MSFIAIVDVDGTIVKHDYPRMGEDIGAQRVLKRWTDEGNKIIVSTMRENRVTEHEQVFGDPTSLTKSNKLQDAVDWYNRNNISLYGIQINPTQHIWTDSKKPYGHVIIDDISLGIPLIKGTGDDRDYVDWDGVEKLLEERGFLSKTLS